MYAARPRPEGVLRPLDRGRITRPQRFVERELRRRRRFRLHRVRRRRERHGRRRLHSLAPKPDRVEVELGRAGERLRDALVPAHSDHRAGDARGRREQVDAVIDVARVATRRRGEREREERGQRRSATDRLERHVVFARQPATREQIPLDPLAPLEHRRRRFARNQDLLIEVVGQARVALEPILGEPCSFARRAVAEPPGSASGRRPRLQLGARAGQVRPLGEVAVLEPAVGQVARPRRRVVVPGQQGVFPDIGGAGLGEGQERHVRQWALVHHQV